MSKTLNKVLSDPNWAADRIDFLEQEALKAVTEVKLVTDMLIDLLGLVPGSGERAFKYLETME